MIGNYFVLFSFLIGTISATGWKRTCPHGMKNIYDSALSGCYALIDPGKGLLTYAQAVEECRALFCAAIPVIMSRREYLEDIVRFAIDEGIPTGGKPGFWLGFTRHIAAPLDANGTLSAENAAIRKNRAWFRYHPRRFPGSVDILKII